MNTKELFSGWLKVALLIACVTGLIAATPIKDLFPQGMMRADLNAGGKSITNLHSVTATNTITAANFVGSGSGLTSIPAPVGTNIISPWALSATNSPAAGKAYIYESGVTGRWGDVSAGGVTSVNVAVPHYSSSGAVTSSGTVTMTATNQAPNTGWYGPASGPAAPPTWRALTSDDIPSLNASKITAGTVTLARGGTGADLSATGGAGQVLKQSTSGGAITVATLTYADIASKPTTISGYGITDALTIPGSSAEGDILYRNGSTWTRLPRGTTGYVPTSPASTVQWSAPSSVLPSRAECRLSTSASSAVTLTDNGNSTVHLHQFRGSKISLYDTGTSTWGEYTLPSTPISVGSFSSTPTTYDIFCYNSSGTPALEKLAWTNINTRATALALQDGVLCKSGDLSRRYVGTVCSNASSQISDTMTSRMCWSMYGQVERNALSQDTGASYTYQTAAWQPLRNTSTLGTTYVEIVRGLDDDPVTGQATIHANNSTGDWRATGIALDSATTTNIAQTWGGAGTGSTPNVATYRGHPGIGVRRFTQIQYSVAAGTTTWYGGGIAGQQGGLFITTRQ